MLTPGQKFRQVLQQEQPLQIVGTINAFSAIMAEKVGFKAVYLSGSGVATAAFGLPDLGMTNSTDVAEEVRRIASATNLPLLVDADTGWGNALNITRTVKQLAAAGAAAIHLEDQTFNKRCGHRDAKKIVTMEEMILRIKIAVAAKPYPEFVIMARTDAVANEGLEAAINRACAYVEAGADMIFAEAITDLTHYQQFVEAVKVPVLANITEFGKTPLFTVPELKKAGVAMVLYPLTAFRAMNAAALNVYKTLRQEGTQKNLLSTMQTRTELYEFLDYENYEAKS